jgi:hypothetical protein
MSKYFQRYFLQVACFNLLLMVCWEPKVISAEASHLVLKSDPSSDSLLIAKDQQRLEQLATKPLTVESLIDKQEVLKKEMAPAINSSVTSEPDLSQPIAASTYLDQSMAQVTSISQLSDVRPSDWAFQALQTLVERYGCIAGYPNGTFRGDRTLTRYEFAAGLNACLDRIAELITTSLTDGITRDDLATLQRLQEEFAAELTTLRGRVDALEARTAELEANEFSTTTRLSGETIFGVVGAGGAYPGNGDESATLGVLSNTRGAAGDNAQITFNYRIRLNLTTSFTGRDALIVGLQSYNFLGDPNSTQGTLGYSDPLSLNASTVRLGFEPQFPGTDPQTLSAISPNTLRLYKLLYVFPALDELNLFVASNVEVTDAFPSVSPFVSDTQGAISRFAPYNAAVRVSGGTSGTGLATAGGFIWNIADWINLVGLYASVNSPIPDNRGLTSSNPTPLGSGLFNGSYVISSQLTLTPASNLKIGLNYANSYHQINILGTGLSSSDIGSILFNPNAGQLAAVGGNPVLAIANEGIRLNSLGATMSWRFMDKVSLVASGSYLFADLVDVNASTNFISWLVGLHVRDIFQQGNSAGLIFGEPLNRDSTSGDAFNPENAEPYHLEGYITFRMSDNITLTPGIFAVFNPEGYSGNNTAVVGALRTSFSF